MKKQKLTFKAEKREQKNRKRMHMSGGSIRQQTKHAGLKLIKTRQ